MQGISFTVEPGQKIGIAGETGSGKTTISKLLLGFYYCESGAIKINGIDIRNYNIKSLRKHISYLGQEPLLFSTSIKKNIKYGKPNCSDEEMHMAASDAEASDFIENLPKKYETYVGNNGSQLSGGQKQRIAFARALVRKPKLIILDEATSALDVLTEVAILNTLKEKYDKTTYIVIAQRLNTIKNTDKIIFLEKGRIVELGSYDDLMENKSYFYNLSQSNRENTKVKEESFNLGSEELVREESLIINIIKQFKTEKSSVPLISLLYPK